MSPRTIKIETRLREVRPLTERARPEWGEQFSDASGFAIALTPRHSMSVFVDRRLVASGSAGRRNFLRDEQAVAHCVSTLGHDWRIMSEPLENGTLGLIAYNAKGKALAAGTARLNDRGTFRARLTTLYDGITNRCRCKFRVYASVNSRGKWAVGGVLEGRC